MFYIGLILVAVFGFCFGSFFNVCIYRIPLKKSIAFPASYCPGCSEPIPVWLNIPIIGFLISSGKCRKCGIKIHWHYPLVEFLTPLLLVLLYWKYGFSVAFFQYAVLFSFGIIIFFIDAFHQIIPDSLSLPLIPLGLIGALLPGSSISFSNSLIAALIGFVLFFSLSWTYFKLRGQTGLGGGDIKLIAGVGSFVGVTGLLFVILVSSVVGLITVLVLRYDLKKQFSFGPFIIFATILYVLYGYILTDLYLSLF